MTKHGGAKFVLVARLTTRLPHVVFRVNGHHYRGPITCVLSATAGAMVV